MTRIIEKSPLHISYLDRNWRAFPAAKVVCIVRHPVDVYTSYVRRRQVETGAGPIGPRNASWLAVTPAQFAKRYGDVVKQISSVAPEKKEQFHVFQYEQFTSNPTQTFRLMCSFVEVPFMPACVEADAPGLSGWKADALLSQKITSQESRWRAYISEREATCIETNLATEMKHLGYSSVL